MVNGNLAEELRQLRDIEGVSFASLSQRTDISRTTISQFVNKGLNLKPAQEEKLRKAVDEIKNQGDYKIDQLPTHQAKTGYKRSIDVFATNEYREAMGWCDYVFSKRKMGVMVGYPGSGKTTILRQFAKLQSGVCYIEAWPQMRLGDLLDTIGRALGIVTQGNNYRKTQQLIAALADRTDVLIAVDEAEYLAKWDVDKFEILRKIWDNTGTPVILCGTTTLENMLTRGRGRRDNLAQLYRRKVELKLTGISTGEIKKLLADYDIAPDVIDAMAAIATDVKHGGMGTFVEILSICLEAAEGGRITEEILSSARKYKLMY